MTEPNTTSQDAAPAPGSPEYDAKMAELGRSAREGTASDIASSFGTPGAEGEAAADTKARPADVPEKFWDAEKGEVRLDALLKSYTELESGKGKAAAEPANKDTQEPNPTQETVEKAGLNWDDLTSKVTTKGTLDDTDFAALEKVGIPKAVAERIIANEVELARHRTADQERATQAAYEYGGGKDATEALLKWASDNLTPEEVTGYNAMLASPNWKVALDTLKTRQAQTKPGNGEPSLVNPTTTAQGGTTVGYKTEDEMRADMRNPLYFQLTPEGETFRAKVQERVRLAAYRRGR